MGGDYARVVQRQGRDSRDMAEQWQSNGEAMAMAENTAEKRNRDGGEKAERQKREGRERWRRDIG